MTALSVGALLVAGGCRGVDIGGLVEPTPTQVTAGQATPTFPPPTAPVVATPTMGVSEDCTFDFMATHFVLVLSDVDKGPASDRPSVEALVAAKFPVAKVEDHALATVATETFPELNDRTFLVYLLSGETRLPPQAPAGQPSLGPVRDMCTLAFYDPETEEYVTSPRNTRFWPAEGQ